MDVLLRLLSNISTEVLVGGFVTLLLGVLVNVFTAVALPQLKRRFGVEEKKPLKSYGEQMAQLTRSLTKASNEVDRILKEMAETSQQRETALATMEKQLETLSEREKQLQQKIETLEKVPLPAVDYFAGIVEKSEKRSAWRDYALFGLGAIASTIIAIILRFIGI